MLHRIGTALVVLLALAGVSPQAWAGKVGPEFRVNSYTAGEQTFPSVAGLSNGSFVVAWVSGVQDGSGGGVYGQRYSAAGARVGKEFRVNTFTAYSQDSPSVAALSNGNFVITWYSDALTIYFQLYSAEGARLGGAGLIDSHANRPSVAELSNGGFVVTWDSFGPDGSRDVYSQRHGAAGKLIGDPPYSRRVNTYTKGDQAHPSVAGLSNGGFVVTWQSSGQDGSGTGVYGQRYSAAGAPVGKEFRVNTRTANSQTNQSVAGLSKGGFVVTWHSDAQGGAREGVYGQRFSATGTRVGGEFLVNTTAAYYAGRQYRPSVAALSKGGFVVNWGSDHQDGYGDVYGQRYSLTGARVGGEFMVNTYVPSVQEFPSVAGLANDSFVVTWFSAWQDGSSGGVFGQRFGP